MIPYQECNTNAQAILCSDTKYMTLPHTKKALAQKGRTLMRKQQCALQIALCSRTRSKTRINAQEPKNTVLLHQKMLCMLPHEDIHARKALCARAHKTSDFRTKASKHYAHKEWCAYTEGAVCSSENQISPSQTANAHAQESLCACTKIQCAQTRKNPPHSKK